MECKYCKVPMKKKKLRYWECQLCGYAFPIDIGDMIL